VTNLNCECTKGLLFFKTSKTRQLFSFHKVIPKVRLLNTFLLQIIITFLGSHIESTRDYAYLIVTMRISPFIYWRTSFPPIFAKAYLSVACIMASAVMSICELLLAVPSQGLLRCAILRFWTYSACSSAFYWVFCASVLDAIS